MWSLRFKTREVPFSVPHRTTGEGGSLQLQPIWAQPLCEQICPCAVPKEASLQTIPRPSLGVQGLQTSLWEWKCSIDVCREHLWLLPDTKENGFRWSSPLLQPTFPTAAKAPLKCFLEPALLCPSPLLPFEAFLCLHLLLRATSPTQFSSHWHCSTLGFL